MTDEKVIEAGAEEAPAEAPVEEAGAERGEPKVGAPLVPDRQVTVRFIRDTKWCVGTSDGATIEVIEADEERELPRETAHGLRRHGRRRVERRRGARRQGRRRGGDAQSPPAQVGHRERPRERLGRRSRGRA